MPRYVESIVDENKKMAGRNILKMVPIIVSTNWCLKTEEFLKNLRRLNIIGR